MSATNDELNERLVICFEAIAKSLEGLHEEARRAGLRYWPQPREQKQAVLSKVETDAERDLKNQGARRRTISEVVDPAAEEEPEIFIGERERQWLRDHPEEAKKSNASTKDTAGNKGTEQDGRGNKETGSEA